MSNKKPCRWFSNPGGCRYGSSCRFSHDLPSGTRSTSPQSMASNGSQHESQSGSAPPGVCRTFWNTGKCRFEFSCRYRHSRQSEAHASSGRGGSPVAMSMAPAPIEVIAPFLTDAGLAKISGPGADAFSSSNRQLDPQVTQAQLRRFLTDDFRFHSTNQIYPFVSLLNNASSENRSWVSIACPYVTTSTDS